MLSSILGPEWNLSPDGINIVTDNGAIKDPKTALKKALDSDLKTIGKPALSSESKFEKIVLQIQKIRNISAPKAKEESQAAPRMLKLTLTDGESYVQAIEETPLNSISREKTAPGTKVLINGANVVSGYLLINSQNFSILGGQVEPLYEKWLLAKTVQQNHQYVLNSGAPPWVAFGCKIISGDDKSFKALEKNKDGDGESEFDQQRKEAIAEASSGAIRKTFGGRVKQNVQPVQHNQQLIRGRPIDRANQDKGNRKSKFESKDDDVVEKLHKPSEKVSLFSFLEDKLPATEVKKSSGPCPSYNKDSSQEYHQKDPKVKQKTEPRQNNRQHYDRNASSSYTSKDKSSYSTSASKPTKPELFTARTLPPKTNFSNNDDPKPNSSENRFSSNSNNTASDSGDANNSFKQSQLRYPRDQNTNANKDSSQQYQSGHNQYRSNNDKYSHQPTQGAQFRSNNERYSQNSSTSNATIPYSRGIVGQQQNQSRNTYDKYYQQNVPPYPRDNFGHQQNHVTPPPPRQQFSNANSYSHSNTSYNPRYQQNTQQDLQTAEMHQLANTLSKMSVSNEFASRSLRQHLNLGPLKKQEPESSSSSLNVGDQCLAKYWEDGKFYPAVIAAVTDKTYAVQFKGYGNIEEILKNDCFSAANSYSQQGRNPNPNYQQNNFSGTMEFRSRRGPPRN